MGTADITSQDNKSAVISAPASLDSSRRRSLELSLSACLLWVAALAYTILYILFWPRSFTSLDEAVYMNMAYTLRHGSIYPDMVGLNIPATFQVGSHIISKYPLGMPALIAFGSLLGWRFVLGINLIIHLLTYWVLLKLLKRYEIPAVYGILYLLYPTEVLYSRTVMADPVSGLLLCAAFLTYLDKRMWQTGGLIGLSILMRTANVIAFAAIFIPLLIDVAQGGVWQRQKTWRRITQFTLAIAPFMLLTLYYAQVIADGQIPKNTGTFSLSYFPGMFSFYCMGLLLLYPAMFCAPALFKGSGKLALILLCYGFVLLYSAWYYRDGGGSFAESLIAGLRYFVAVMPLWILAYGQFLNRLIIRLQRVIRPVSHLQEGIAAFRLMLPVTTILFIIAIAISVKHQRYVSQMDIIRTYLVQLVPANDLLVCSTQVSKLMHPGFGYRHLVIVGGAPKPEDWARNRKFIEDNLFHGGRNVYFAVWQRDNHADDLKDSILMDRMISEIQHEPNASGFKAIFQANEIHDHSLPNGVKLIRYGR